MRGSDEALRSHSVRPLRGRGCFEPQNCESCGLECQTASFGSTDVAMTSWVLLR